MGQGVKSIREYRQDKCLHRVEKIDPVKNNGFRYLCKVCGRPMVRLNGTLWRVTP